MYKIIKILTILLSLFFVNNVSIAQNKGGTLTVGTTGDILNFDAFQLGFISYPNLHQCYDSLITYDSQLRILPRLATFWRVNDDGTELTFSLRRNVKWHNGREFVAADVVKNIEKALSPSGGHNVHGMVKKTMLGAEVLDKYSVLIKFRAPTPNMFDIFNAMRMMAPESFDTLKNKCIGTGPFKLEEWIPGDQLVYTKNQDFWQPGRPLLDKVIFKPYSDLEALNSALETGLIGAAVAVPPKDYKRLKNSGLDILFGQTGALLYSITVNPPDPDQPEGPLSDKRVRQAICHSIDRDAIIDQALFGVGGATVVPSPTYSIAYFPEYANHYGFSLDKAARLLDSAGWKDSNGDGIREKNGKDLILNTITIQAYPETTDMAQILKSDLNKIGVDVDIEPLDSATYGPRHLGTKATDGSAVFDLDVTFVGRQHLDPMGLFDNSPYRHFSSPIFPRDNFPDGYVNNLEKAGSTVDITERKKAFKKVQEIILDACVDIPISWKYTLFAKQNNVHDLGWTVNDEIKIENTWID